jgi:hypothetical protein
MGYSNMMLRIGGKDGAMSLYNKKLSYDTKVSGF